MSDSAESEITALVDQIADALRHDEDPYRSQRLVVRLAARAGWEQTRRLVLAAGTRGLSGTA